MRHNIQKNHHHKASWESTGIPETLPPSSDDFVNLKEVKIRQSQKVTYKFCYNVDPLLVPHYIMRSLDHPPLDNTLTNNNNNGRSQELT